MKYTSETCNLHRTYLKITATVPHNNGNRYIKSLINIFAPTHQILAPESVKIDNPLGRYGNCQRSQNCIN
ncbi:hypothetical protein [Limnofasciculus baicalensis]|uniref:Uncharacterized protein n=1 Tax=Limnofasciculus baicalensis BBK-W-15 TaxID=2699891 RepID=A0AAE3GTI5_9CYAN|nr:hypothetical protein [Limnofasciculus baicalensis]MCP2730044.1 hypothetical protein [Limnofasciculus baicalensis BBK-W-15]